MGGLAHLSASSADEDLSFDAPIIVVTVLFIVGGAWLLSRWRSVWSATAPAGVAPVDRGARAWESIHPYAGVPILSFGVMLLAIGITTSVPQPAQDVLWFFTALIMCATAVSFGLLATIALFGRPKALVPPHARDLGGYLGGPR